MQGIKLFKGAIEKHRENKDVRPVDSQHPTPPALTFHTDQREVQDATYYPQHQRAR